jgi:cyclopropane fatty-acyl-phospholipid synthase-like methyltransferase
MSTGGRNLIEAAVASKLGDIKPGSRVLDVGCGLGGNMLYFASPEKACFVHGIDISGVMVSIASERYLKYPAEIQKRISIQVGDIFDSNFIPNSFDIICCRDFLMHFSHNDAEILLSKFHRWLAPGGSVIISDYVRGGTTSAENSLEFTNYIDERKYHLTTEEEYMYVFKNLNFTACSVSDIGMGEGTRKTQFERYLTNQVEDFRSLCQAKTTDMMRLKDSVNVPQLFDLVYNTVATHLKLPNGGDDELAVRIAQAGASATQDYIESVEALSCEDQQNLDWVEKYWSIKIRAVQSEELSYSVFIATTPRS